MHAIQNLLEDVEEALRLPKGKLHAVFIDYTKAFDLLNRSKLIVKLQALIGRKNPIASIIKNILAYNLVTIDDNICLSNPIIQGNGVPQGDPMSPVLFNVATCDIIENVKDQDNEVKIYMYADDMVMASKSIEKLQTSFDKLTKWAEENEFIINKGKTVQMTFRKGGRTSASDRIFYRAEQEPLKAENSFKYLGMTLQTTGNTFSRHVKDKAAAAVAAMSDIKMANRLSTTTSLRLFTAKITPIVTYGLHIIWQHLSKKNLQDIENVKATYLKRVLCLSKYTKSRLCYELTREPFYIEDLRYQLLLPSTTAYQELLADLEEKKKSIWEQFYSTEAMTTSKWMNADYDLRHIVTRSAVHGFHHLICTTKVYHSPNENCVCVLCSGSCDRYHAVSCSKRATSFTEFCQN